MKSIFKILLSAIIFVSTFANAQKFTLPVMPDTQVEVGGNTEMYLSRFKWVLLHKENIPFVLHIGDLVDFNNNEQYSVYQPRLARCLAGA